MKSKFAWFLLLVLGGLLLHGELAAAQGQDHSGKLGFNQRNSHGSAIRGRAIHSFVRFGYTSAYPPAYGHRVLQHGHPRIYRRGHSLWSGNHLGPHLHGGRSHSFGIPGGFVYSRSYHDLHPYSLPHSLPAYSARRRVIRCY